MLFPYSWEDCLHLSIHNRLQRKWCSKANMVSAGYGYVCLISPQYPYMRSMSYKTTTMKRRKKSGRLPGTIYSLRIWKDDWCPLLLQILNWVQSVRSRSTSWRLYWRAQLSLRNRRFYSCGMINIMWPISTKSSPIEHINSFHHKTNIIYKSRYPSKMMG